MGLLFTYLVTFGGAAISLVNPFYGFLAYVCFAIVRPEAMWFWSVPRGSYSRVIAIGMLIGWALHGFGDWRIGKSRALVLSLIVFWLCTALGTLFAENAAFANFYFETLTKIVLPFIVAVTLIDSVPKLLQLAWCIVLSEGYVALELNRSYFSGGQNFGYQMAFGSLDNNGIALTMVCGTAFALFLGIQTKTWYGKIVGAGASLLMLHTVLLTFSRGGMLGLVVSGMAGFCVVPKRPKHFLMFAAAVAIGFALAGKEVSERFMTMFVEEVERDSSADSRIELSKACLDLMYKNPLGIGPEQFSVISYQYGFKKYKAAHTTWLQIGAEQGVIGLVSIMVFYLLCISRLWRLARQRNPDDPRLCALARIVIVGLPGFIVSAQFISLALVEIPYYLVLIGSGVLRLSSVAVAGHDDLHGLGIDLPFEREFPHTNIMEEDRVFE